MAWVFSGLGLCILLFTMISWYLEISPRLKNEAIQNLQVLGDSHARSVEAYIDDLENPDNLSAIYDSFNELLLLIDPSTQQNIFKGAEIEFDFQLRTKPASLPRIQVGEVNCPDCIKTETPLFSPTRGELVAILKIYASPGLYHQLLFDIGIRIAGVIAALLVVVLLAWMITARLLKALVKRERNLEQEVAERKSAEARLHQIAAYDQLTNLPNRYLLNTEFHNKLAEAARVKNSLAVLFFDLDNFKTINDIYGHETGDMLLVEVARRVSGSIREYDLLARFGGDEFVMIMPFSKGQGEIYTVLDKIINSFTDEFVLGEHKVRVTSSVGISVYPQDGDSPDQLLKNADLAMYRAKSEGRNGYHFFTASMNQELRRAQWIENHLKQALENDELELYFQPQWCSKSDRIDSCEALLRWPQVDGTMLSPNEFIPVAEQSGQIYDVTQWVLHESLKHHLEWQLAGYRAVRIDINLSGRDFSRNQLASNLEGLIDETPDLIEKIGIEITENILLEASDEKKALLHRLHNRGLHIAIDDFGTGYSSMSYLKNFTVSSIKIDQTFVRDAPEHDDDQTIINAIVMLGHGLGMIVVAEGVETDAHVELCKNAQCDLLQGYSLSEPLPANEFCERFLEVLSS
jgi:diguanylate cyclase (GGDEF)-like protein